VARVGVGFDLGALPRKQLGLELGYPPRLSFRSCARLRVGRRLRLDLRSLRVESGTLTSAVLLCLNTLSGEDFRCALRIGPRAGCRRGFGFGVLARSRFIKRVLLCRDSLACGLFRFALGLGAGFRLCPRCGFRGGARLRLRCGFTLGYDPPLGESHRCVLRFLPGESFVGETCVGLAA